MYRYTRDIWSVPPADGPLTSGSTLNSSLKLPGLYATKGCGSLIWDLLNSARLQSRHGPFSVEF